MIGAVGLTAPFNYSSPVSGELWCLRMLIGSSPSPSAMIDGPGVGLYWRRMLMGSSGVGMVGLAVAGAPGSTPLQKAR